MSLVVITEGPSDGATLADALGVRHRPGECRFMSAGGRSAAVSLARSVLATTSDSVALVVDADATAEEEVERRRRYIRDALTDVADESRFLLLLAIPDLATALSRQRDATVSELSRFIADAQHVRN